MARALVGDDEMLLWEGLTAEGPGPQHALDIYGKALRKPSRPGRKAKCSIPSEEGGVWEFDEDVDNAADWPEVSETDPATTLQQASYKAEIHELMLNMREQTEMQAALSAKMRRLQQPSLTVEAEPDENVLNTASPSRRSSWTLASELMTPARPTTGGMQTPTGQPDAVTRDIGKR